MWRTPMHYNRKRLRSLARDMLRIAQENLRRDGDLQPVGLIYTNAGLSQVFPFRCQGLDQKRSSQQEFRKLLLQLKARAAIVVTESWLKVRPELPLDLTRSIADLPDKEEAVVIEAASPKSRYMIMQVFRKDESGKLHFETPMEPDHPITWSSEWLDGIWSERRSEWST